MSPSAPFVPTDVQMSEKKKKNSGDIPKDNVPEELSLMSLTDRARLAALVELDGDENLRAHLLGAIGRAETGRGSRQRARDVPMVWTQIHVLDRLEEAFEVLSALPAKTRPKQYGNAMPTVVQERPSLKDLLDMSEGGQLEQFEQDRNRVRLAATAAMVTRMDQALRWPFEHLSHQPELARAVSLRALWAAMRIDIRKRCERHGLHHETFNVQWQAGLGIITGRLIARRVPVS
jgi:hypothetical protein